MVPDGFTAMREYIHNQEVIFMPSMSDIIRDSVVDFSRLQDWMISAKKNKDHETYELMYQRYIELKVIL